MLEGYDSSRGERPSGPGLQGYQSKLLSFDKKEHKSKEVLKLNPRGLLPTFRHGNVVVNESMAVCLYLENAFKSQGTCLIPENPAENGTVYQRLIEGINLYKATMDDLIDYFYYTKIEDRNMESIKERKRKLSAELDIWEGYVKASGAFIAGKDFSMADVINFPPLGFLVRLGWDLSQRWPSLNAYHTRMCERPSVRASRPHHWKDSNGPLFLARVQNKPADSYRIWEK